MSNIRPFLPPLALSLLLLGLSGPVRAQSLPAPVFPMHAFLVEGNSLLPMATVDAALAPFRGPSRHFGDIQQALEKLQALYQEAGYGTVQVLLPEQELQDGQVRFQVIERRLGEVQIEGARFFDAENIRNSLPGLVPGTVPNLKAVSRSLRIANENPAKQTLLQLSGNTDAVDAHLRISDGKPWKIALNLDNTGTDATGRTRLGVLFQHANLFNRDHVATFQYTTSPEKPERVSIYGLGYRIPLYAWGDSLDLFAAHSDVDSGTLTAGVLALSVSGKGKVHGARYNQTLPRLGDYEQKLVYGIDHKAYENDIGFRDTPLGHDITVRPLSLTYIGSWNRPEATITGFLSVARNLPGGSHGGTTDFQRARAGAEADYRLFRYGLNGHWTLAQDWQFRASLSGQATPDRLVPGEQFGLGGASSVRGFQERQFSDDRGLLLSAEVYSPELCSRSLAANCRLLAFYDHGELGRNGALPGERESGTLSSAGLGLRLEVGRHVSLRMDVGRILDDNDSGSKGNTRLHFLLGVSY